MYDQALVWITDTDLEATSFTARLRDLAGIGNRYRRIHVSDLWSPNDPFGLIVKAHRWALAGESVAFELPAFGSTYHVTLDPLVDQRGSVIGVSGHADDAARTTADDPFAHDLEHHAGIGTWREDLLTGSVTVSPGLSAMLGLEAGATSFDPRDHDHPADRNVVEETIAGSPDGYSCDHRVRCPAGRVRSVRERVKTVADERGMPIARLGSLLDITDLKEREAELADLALYDPLTRLPNRALLAERMTSALTRARRHETHCAALFIDLDEFKQVNDAFGHAAGDRLLVGVASRLQQYVRTSDTVARLAGDEFVMLMEDLYSEQAALSAARKVLRAFDEPFDLGGERSVTVHASIGVAVAPRVGDTPERLLAVADREMYAVKRNGGHDVKLAGCEQERRTRPTEKAPCRTGSSKDRNLYVIRASA